MFRFLFFLACVLFGWLIISAVVKAIIRAFGGNRLHGGTGRNPSQPEANQTFNDIRDAEYTDITEKKK